MSSCLSSTMSVYDSTPNTHNNGWISRALRSMGEPPGNSHTYEHNCPLHHHPRFDVSRTPLCPFHKYLLMLRLGNKNSIDTEDSHRRRPERPPVLVPPSLL